MSILPSPFDLPAAGCLALDLGQARSGAAACDAEGILATPLVVLRRHATRAEDYAVIGALVARRSVVGVVVGLPLASQGEEGSQARWVRRYAGRLAGALSVPVAFWDESYSSADADRLISEGSGRTPRGRGGGGGDSAGVPGSPAQREPVAALASLRGAAARSSLPCRIGLALGRRPRHDGARREYRLTLGSVVLARFAVFCSVLCFSWCP